MYESAPAFGGVGVAADKAYQNAKANSDQQNARIEHDKALQLVMTGLLAAHIQCLRTQGQFVDVLWFGMTVEEFHGGASTSNHAS